MEQVLVLLILAAGVVAFATEKVPIDLVAVLIMGVLLFTGLVTVEEGLSGFSNPATITVGAMFVLSAALTRTGVLQPLARFLVRFSRHPFVFLLLLIPLAAFPSAFINNTPVVAVFLPLVLAVCAKRGFSPSKFLIPLSCAAQFGGTCTLIGTSTNLLVSALAERAGYRPFTMFEFSQLGLIFVAIGTAYFLLLGYWLLPKRAGQELTTTYQLGEYITEMRVLPGSSLVGQSVAQAHIGQRYEVTVLEILREDQTLFSPTDEPIRERDILIVRGRVEELMHFKNATGLAIEPEFKLRDALLRRDHITLAEALIPPQSSWIGRTLIELNFHRLTNTIVLAIQRHGQAIREKLRTVRLRMGDALLLMGSKTDVARLRADPNVIVLEPVDEPSLRHHRRPVAVLIVCLVVALATLPVWQGKPLPILVTALLGAVALVLSRCLSLSEAYSAIDWRVIFLLAGVIPLGVAMEKTGVAARFAEWGVWLAGPLGPVAVLSMFYLLTAVLTEVMSNNACAVLLTPIAISTAEQLGVSPTPFLMAVMFAASTAFATPIGYQTNTMVYNPGGYRFSDFLRVGIPLNLIFWATATVLIPRFWPF
ncbi:MAG: SLC13 family permease [Verrucomicrobiae bacterium]|nr:SLC13 family permease [Verrucomicrobiae bacterium]